jgi:hypothetical protein
MPSYLRRRVNVPSDMLSGLVGSGSTSRRRQVRTVGLYGLTVLAATLTMALSSQPSVHAVALGMIAPGSGFLVWSMPAPLHGMLPALLAAAGALVVMLALVKWFATGNVIAPAAAWILSALAAGMTGPVTDAAPIPTIPWIVPAVDSSVVAGWFVFFLLTQRIQPSAAPCRLTTASMPTAHDVERAELTPETLQLMRLVLDRALQPVDRFAGFEWTDQFQTSAVRYQINFMSYALSLAQRTHLSAFQGYLHDAQRNLAAKQQDHRIWRYWRQENLWGHLSACADPIPRDNIMFSGFVATQLALFQNATGLRNYNDEASLVFEHPSGRRFVYSLPTIVDLLTESYRRAPFCLLACEPHWIYPLCNSITAAGLRAHSPQQWEIIRERLREKLEDEFTTPVGRFLPFRSSLTGFAPPPLGGAVMEAMPIYFLSALFPDLARRHWDGLRPALAPDRLRRSCWPVDVGNYRFTRASSYAGVAIAAVEMGEKEITDRVLEAFDSECPSLLHEGVRHRPGVSLWSHAVELMARCGAGGTLRDLVENPTPPELPGPYLAHAPYPKVLVAHAVRERSTLRLVLYPGSQSCVADLRLGGLPRGRTFALRGVPQEEGRADDHGNAVLSVALEGRTEILVRTW